MTINRRRLLKGIGAAAAAGTTTGLASPAIAQAAAKVIVIGGGAGGATAAKYIAKDAGGKIDVTIIEPARAFTTCFHSNLWVGGFKTMANITHTYDKLKSAYGIKHIPQMAAAINRDKKTVRLAEVGTIAYDRLVVSPGIDLKFDSVPGYSEGASQTMPHAWKAGPQTELLIKQLNALQDGATIVMIAPPNPYRCPPGPYERVSMFAHVLKAKGHAKSKIIVLDPKETFSKQALFLEGWQKHYPGMVEWQDPKQHGGIKGVDAKSMTVKTDLADYKADMVNVIPAQTAGRIALAAGLAGQGAYCAVKPESMQSAVDANIYVLGDASIAGDMPKSGFSANSQAKVAANAIRGELMGARVFPARYTNTCWSLIETDDTVKVGGRYEPKEGKIAAVETFVSKTGETAELRKQTSEENIGWYSGIIADMFS
jgi:NADPH-dependent 2,4-dienoyl-CoA reductase/sulfur reductase-like enzyme